MFIKRRNVRKVFKKDESAKIPLENSSESALVSKVDEEWARRFKWYCLEDGHIYTPCIFPEDPMIRVVQMAEIVLMKHHHNFNPYDLTPYLGPFTPFTHHLRVSLSPYSVGVTKQMVQSEEDLQNIFEEMVRIGDATKDRLGRYSLTEKGKQTLMRAKKENQNG